MAEQVLEATERFQAMNQKLKMAEMYKERYGRKYNHKVKLDQFKPHLTAC